MGTVSFIMEITVGKSEPESNTRGQTGTEKESYDNGRMFSPLAFFLNTCFLLLYTPFWLKWNPQENCYVIQRHKVQQFLCALCHLFVMHFQYFILFHHYYEHGNTQATFQSTINAACDLISYLGSIVFVHLLFKLVWFQGDRVNSLVNSTVCSWPQNSMSLTFFKVSIVIGFAVFTIFDWNSAKGIIANMELSMNDGDYTRYKALTKFLVSEKSPFPRVVWEGISTHVLNFFMVSHGFLFALSCSLIGMAGEFEQRLLGPSMASVEKGIRMYQELKEKLQVINGIISHKLVAFYALVLGYYCEAPDLFRGYFFQESWLSQASYLFFNCGMWIGAAEFHSRVQLVTITWQNLRLFESMRGKSLKKDEHGEKITRPSWSMAQDNTQLGMDLKLVAFKNEVFAEPIGLSCRFFTVTNRFLSSMVGVVVTYAIIVYQMQPSF